MAAHALDPFETWPVQLYDASLELYVWFARPAVIVSQAHQRVAQVEHARLLSAAIERALVEHAREIDMHAGLLIIHDWRVIDEYSDGARAYYSKRVERYQAGQVRGVYLAVAANPLIRSMLQLGASALPFLTGQRLNFVADPLPLLAQHDVTPLFGPHPFRRTLFPSLAP